MSEEERKKAFLQKHRPLAPQDVYKKIEDADRSREKYTRDVSKVEENLVKYLNKEDPLVDPGTDTVIAWLRRLSYREMRELIPTEMYDAYFTALAGDEEELKKVSKKYEEYVFNLMEEMITIPKRTAEKWKDLGNLEFIELFQTRLVELMSRLREQTDFF